MCSIDPVFHIANNSKAYWTLAIACASYFGYRAYRIQLDKIPNENIDRTTKHLRPWQRHDWWTVHIIQDVIFNMLGAMAGFAALQYGCRLLLYIGNDFSKLNTSL